MSDKILQINIEVAKASYDIAHYVADKNEIDIIFLARTEQKMVSNSKCISNLRQDVAILCGNKNTGEGVDMLHFWRLGGVCLLFA